MDEKIIHLLNKFEDEKIYWLAKLRGILDETRFPPDFTDGLEHKKEIYKTFFDNQLTGKIDRISKNNDLSLYVMLLAAFKVLMAKYANLDDIVIASPMHIKDGKDYNEFILLRDFVDMDMTFMDVLMGVKETVSHAYKNQHYPLKKIFETLGYKNLSFVNIIMLLKSIHKAGILDNITPSPKNDITLSIRRTNHGLEAEIIYNSKLSGESTIQRIFKLYMRVLNWVLSNIKVKLAKMELIPGEEKQKVLRDFNKTGTEFPANIAIQEFFAARAAEKPDNIAVVFEDEQVKYSQLNERANRLARLLTEKNAQPGGIVGIMIDSSIEMVIAILAVLKAGCAYLPIDPGYPGKRINDILGDCSTRLLLTKKSFTPLIREFESNLLTICIDEIDTAGYESANIKRMNKGTNPAYVIYTSGTTGTPRGIMVEHKGLVNYTLWRLNAYHYTETDVALQLLSYVFDGFMSNFFTSLLSGGTLVMVPDSQKMDVNYIKEKMKKNKVTNMSLVPELYALLLDGIGSEYFQSLRFVVLAGEKSKPWIIERSREKNPNIRHIIEYGPTEATVTAAANIGIKSTDTAIIGTSVANTKIYILDSSLKPVPIGCQGEIFIAGRGVSAGYLNNPGLTAEKFIKNPFKTGETLYRTGDLAKWKPGGYIEFLGRIDHQLKVRGFRIEPEEIEKQILKHEHIKEAKVISTEMKKGEKSLCAYIVSAKELKVQELREYLTGKLPEYMIPLYFMQIQRIPLNPNGKLDLNALPKPVPTSGKDYAAPRDEREEKIVEIWSEVLGAGKEDIGIDSNFFDLGGHSLKGTALVSRLHKEFNIMVPLVDIFKKPTIRELSEYMKGVKENKYASIQKAEKKAYYRLSSAQKRMFIIHQLDNKNIAYNIPTVVLLEGRIDKENIAETFNKLIRRHESLRTSFEQTGNGPVQKIHQNFEFKMGFFEEKDEDAAALIKKLVKPFDLEKAPLLRVDLITISEERHLMVVDIHHIIADGVSLGILVRDFISLYEWEELPPLSIQYKDFQLWQDSEFESDWIRWQKKYLLERFSDHIPVLDIPTDYPRPEVQQFEGNFLAFEIDEAITGRLRTIAAKKGVTLYMFLLAVYTILLSKYTGQNDIIVGSPVSGRRHADLENIIGMFINVLLMRNFPEPTRSFNDFLMEVKVNALQAFENQDYPFEKLVEQLDLTRDSSRNPLYDAVFAIQDLEIPSWENSQLKLKPFGYENKTSKTDLRIGAFINSNKIELVLTYSTALFKRETAQKMTERFVYILKQVLNNMDIKLKDIQVPLDFAKSKPASRRDNDSNVDW